MPILAWVLSPIGRYVAIFLATIVLLGGLYWKFRSSIESDVQVEIMQDSLKRIEDAVRAGDAVDTRPERLRQPDKACRDCE